MRCGPMASDLASRLGEWVGAGLISDDQAAAIEAHERAGEGSSTSSSIAEVVGYLGAALVLIAGALIVGQFWDQIRPWGRIALTATLSLVLFAAGWAFRRVQTPAVRRLTSVLWFATVIGVAFTVGLAVGERLLDTDRAFALIVTSVVTLAAGGLYALRQSPLQLIALGLGVASTAIAAATYPQAEVDPLFIGLLLWGLGVACVLLSAGGWLHPATTGQVLGLLGVGIGAETATFGQYTAVGLTIGLVSTAVLLAVSVTARSTLLLGFAVAGIFVVVPHAVFHFFGDSIGAPFALLLTGLLLVGAAVGLVRLRREIAEPPEVAEAAEPPGVAEAGEPPEVTEAGEPPEIADDGGLR
ncbi:hypothetical protein BH23ACT9_BH23ACT9_02420 [soil metagenome]